MVGFGCVAGKLGLGSEDDYNTPQKVSLSKLQVFHAADYLKDYQIYGQKAF